MSVEVHFLYFNHEQRFRRKSVVVTDVTTIKEAEDSVVSRYKGDAWVLESRVLSVAKA